MLTLTDENTLLFIIDLLNVVVVKMLKKNTNKLVIKTLPESPESPETRKVRFTLPESDENITDDEAKSRRPRRSPLPKRVARAPLPTPIGKRVDDHKVHGTAHYVNGTLNFSNTDYKPVENNEQDVEMLEADKTNSILPLHKRSFKIPKFKFTFHNSSNSELLKNTPSNFNGLRDELISSRHSNHKETVKIYKSKSRRKTCTQILFSPTKCMRRPKNKQKNDADEADTLRVPAVDIAIEKCNYKIYNDGNDNGDGRVDKPLNRNGFKNWFSFKSFGYGQKNANFTNDLTNQLNVLNINEKITYQPSKFPKSMQLNENKVQLASNQNLTEFLTFSDGWQQLQTQCDSNFDSMFFHHNNDYANSSKCFSNSSCKNINNNNNKQKQQIAAGSVSVDYGTLKNSDIKK